MLKEMPKEMPKNNYKTLKIWDFLHERLDIAVAGKKVSKQDYASEIIKAGLRPPRKPPRKKQP